ncbi:unnamed protein product [Prunus brigantina]
MEVKVTILRDMGLSFVVKLVEVKVTILRDMGLSFVVKLVEVKVTILQVVATMEKEAEDRCELCDYFC